MFCQQKGWQNHNLKIAIKYFKSVAESEVFGNDINKFSIIFLFNLLAPEFYI
jgi:hypothetical protein